MRIELRRQPRNSAQATITYRAAGTGDRHSATLLDVGPSGAALRLDRPHRLHESLHLEGLPDQAGPNGSRCQGVVRWVRKDGEAYQVGVEFL